MTPAGSKTLRLRNWLQMFKQTFGRLSIWWPVFVLLEITALVIVVRGGMASENQTVAVLLWIWCWQLWALVECPWQRFMRGERLRVFCSFVVGAIIIPAGFIAAWSPRIAEANGLIRWIDQNNQGPGTIPR